MPKCTVLNAVLEIRREVVLSCQDLMIEMLYVLQEQGKSSPSSDSIDQSLLPVHVFVAECFRGHYQTLSSSMNSFLHVCFSFRPWVGITWSSLSLYLISVLSNPLTFPFSFPPRFLFCLQVCLSSLLCREEAEAEDREPHS